MVLNDPLANVMSKLQNSLRSGKDQITVKPASGLIIRILELLKSRGYVQEFTLVKDSRGNYITISGFQQINKCGVIKPRFNFKLDETITYEQRYLPARGFGIIIVSTNQGLMTMDEAKEKHVGGKLVAYCY